jgi:enterochelin esterase-like enzyme
MNLSNVFRLIPSLLLILSNLPTIPSEWTNVQFSSFFSTSRNQTVDFAIYTPPGYESGDQHYPVLYFLHGVSSGYLMYWAQISEAIPESNGDAGAWVNQLITTGIIPPMIIVTPDDAEGSWGEMNEIMVTQELVAYVDSHWRTIPDRSGRAIEGFSMGAMGASRYAARNSDLYCSTIIMALPDAEAQISHWQDNLENILIDQLTTRLIVGEEDGCCYDSTVQFHNDLLTIGIPHEFETYTNIIHYFGDLYNSSGIEGLQFHANCFENANPPPSEVNNTYLPTVHRRYKSE